MFLGTNIAILVVLGIVLQLLDVEGILDEQGVGLDLKALFVFAAGAVPSSLLPFPSEPSSDLPAPRSSPSLKLPNETWLADIIRRQARQAEIGMPKVVIYDFPDINAFATSMRRNDALVAMGTGLLRSMDSDEAEAVLGHDQSCS